MELDAEEMVQPNQLKTVVEATEMRPEPTTWEILLEQSELLGDLWGLMRSQLEELKELRRAIRAMGLAMDNTIDRMSQMEEGSGNGNDGAWSIWRMEMYLEWKSKMTVF